MTPHLYCRLYPMHFGCKCKLSRLSPNNFLHDSFPAVKKVVRKKYQLFAAACICKRLWSPGIDSEELIPPVWESDPGLLKRSTNTGADCHNLEGYASRLTIGKFTIIFHQNPHGFCFYLIDTLYVFSILD